MNKTKVETVKYIYEDMAYGKIPKRDKNSNKNDFGSLVIIGGSRGMAGAVVLAANAALRAGAGKVTIIVPEQIWDIAAIKVTEAMTFGVGSGSCFDAENAETVIGRLNLYNAAVVGCGMSCNDGTRDFFKKILFNFEKTTVIDADALNCLSSYTNDLKSAKAIHILTPHTGEMARLCNKNVEYINSNRVDTALEFALQYRCVVVLKGYETVVADYNGNVFVNTTGNPCLAKGGSGDVLAGIIGGLLATGLAPTDAAMSGVYIHGAAADRCAKVMNENEVLASDLLTRLWSTSN